MLLKKLHIAEGKSSTGPALHSCDDFAIAAYEALAGYCRAGCRKLITLYIILYVLLYHIVYKCIVYKRGCGTSDVHSFCRGRAGNKYHHDEDTIDHVACTAGVVLTPGHFTIL